MRTKSFDEIDTYTSCLLSVNLLVLKVALKKTIMLKFLRKVSACYFFILEFLNSPENQNLFQNQKNMRKTILMWKTLTIAKIWLCFTRKELNISLVYVWSYKKFNTN